MARILWYSLANLWFAPAASDVEVIPVGYDTSENELREATRAGNYWFFFEPTPHPGLLYDPVRLADRLSQIAPRPTRTIAFVTDPSPTRWETQCAFAAQVGLILGVTPRVQKVRVFGVDSPGSNLEAKAHPDEPGPLNPGPRVDWARALNDAVTRRPQFVEPIAEVPALFAQLYLTRGRGKRKFSALAREVLHTVAVSDLAVRAEDIAGVLGRQRGTVQRAITGIANEFSDTTEGRDGPEVVGHLVYAYGWFLQANQP